MAQHEWFATYGGPHLLVSAEWLPFWRGIEGCSDHQDPADESDYARACRIAGWLGTLDCGGGTALVLGGDVGDVACIRLDRMHAVYLVQWLGIDHEAGIDDALRSKHLEEVLSGPRSESLSFATARSGVMRLIDSAESGADLLKDGITFTLRPGHYRVRAGCFESEDMMMVVREMVWMAALDDES
ncbi:MAG: Imm21 family immunity protein [Pseudomonadota bacterium]